MNSPRRFVCVWTLIAAVALSATTTLAAPTEQVRTASGTVTAVAPASKTIVVEAKVGGTTLVIGADVPEGTPIKGAKSLAEIKAGNHVTIQWIKTDSGLTAKSISLLSSK